MPEDKLVYVRNPEYVESLPAPIGNTQIASGEKENVHLLDYWRIIVGRRWTVIAVAVTAVIATAIWTFRQTPYYRATAIVQIERESQNTLDFKQFFGADESYIDYTLQSYYRILSSRSLAKEVVLDLRKEIAPELASDPPSFVQSYLASARQLLTFNSASKPNAVEPDELRPLIDTYVGRVFVVPVRQSWLAQVSFEAKDPQLAALVINTHIKHFIEQNIQNKFDATQLASKFLSQQLVTLKADLEKAEDRLQEYSRQNNLVFTEEGRNTVTEKLQQLEVEYGRVQAERFQKESYDHLIQTGNEESLPQVMSSTLISSLSGRLSELQREESELAVTFAPEYPSRKRIRSQVEEIKKSIEGEKRRIVSSVQAEYAAAQQRERLLTTALEAQKETVNTVNQQIIQYNILKREADSEKQLFDGISTRLKEGEVSAGLRASNIRMVDPAEIPKSAIRPQKGMNLMLGLVFGLVTGVGLAFFQEYIDSSIKSPDDVARFLQVPTLGTIPKLESLGKRRKYGYGSGYGYGYGKYAYGHNRSKPKEIEGQDSSSEPNKDQKRQIDLISHTDPTSLMSEAFRSVRTSLILSSERPPKLILVTSAAPSEGKTVTAVNLAISLTQSRARVALIDCDMRKPRVHKVFKMKPRIGLSNFLAGTISLKDTIQETPVPSLFMLPCGPIPPNPAELVLSDRLKQLLEVLPQYFDYVVIDSPPLSNVSDARILSPLCDTAILVVKAFSTSRHLVRRALSYLSDSRGKIAGIVLNDLDIKKRSAYYYPYYSKAYPYLYYGLPSQDYGDPAEPSDPSSHSNQTAAKS